MAESHATAHWNGDLFGGKGRVAPESGSFGELPLTWEGRTDRPEGSTSPEELIAAAHAGCFSMALANVLAQEGYTLNSLRVDATVTFKADDAGARIVSSHLDATATEASGLDSEGFKSAVDKAKDGCPVSKALAGNIEITASAKLG